MALSKHRTRDPPTFHQKRSVARNHTKTDPFALYFTRSVPWKPGFLCRGTLNHPTQYGVSYHQRKANLSTKTGNLLAAVRIGSLDGVNGRKLLRHMGSIRVEGPELQTTQPEHKFVAWWRKAICLLWTKGYLDCEHTLDFGRVERELVEIASEREVALFSGSQEQEAVAVCDSQLFL
ncbi:hypothetical protein CALVIDRAFT_598402 [Calocera viscosa TUFC12733]|uniref:Uncharacterized protein n=1 Tax=Calocera viscosa (strain TUFC12733) TaxID=1330018 RepID=A0A167M923_CALVF|nr:hypothetical protein CALVIDRAFT_598402 [Calocera viscosa TUFC12733]